MSNDKCVEILGQKFYYPTTLYETLGVLVAFLAISAVTWTLAVEAKRENIDSLKWWQSGSVPQSGEAKFNSDTKLIQFWTPSKKTKNKPNTPEQWEIIDDKENEEDKLIKFAEELKKDGRVQGYRRYEIFGQGNTNPKWGWWWAMTVNGDYKAEDLMKAYSSFWKNNKPVYFEVTNSEIGHKKK